jgi:hypothetical protein
MPKLATRLSLGGAAIGAFAAIDGISAATIFQRMPCPVPSVEKWTR